MEVVAGRPVASVIASESLRSAAGPVQLPEVPFQAIAWIGASASSSAASTIGPTSNWSRSSSESEMLVTGMRVKWLEICPISSW